MKVLFLSPQPYFQERGTSIANKLLLRAFSDSGHSVDLLTFHLGEDDVFENMRLMRIDPPSAPQSIDPGFSLRKIYCDFFLFRDAYRLVKTNEYDLIHAVEEAGFMAMFLSRIAGVPYVLDMDSSMSAQLLARFSWLRPLRNLLEWLESLPIRRAIAVVPMCDDLVEFARKYNNGIVHVLRDVSLLSDSDETVPEDLRATYKISGPILMYVGNLEKYQGIDLFLECMANLARSQIAATAVIIGGSDEDIDKYKSKARELGLEERFLLVGPRPVAGLGSYLRQADILVSPRTQGTNTPMKIYSYLDSGVPVVATDLPTHTQVMSEQEAVLTPVDSTEMASAIGRLINDPQERDRLSGNARDLIKRNHSWASFKDTTDELFQKLTKLLSTKAAK